MKHSKQCIKIMHQTVSLRTKKRKQFSNLPSYLSASLCLFCHFTKLTVAAFFGENFCLWRMQTVQSSLSRGPFNLSCLFPKILLPCECSLHHIHNNVGMVKETCHYILRQIEKALPAQSISFSH